MATINQQPPNIDFSLQLHPTPASMHDSHPLARLRLETAWSNRMTWNLANVVNYCFDDNDMQSERSVRKQRWQTLSDEVQQWANERPDAFDPIWQGNAGETGSFPEIWFTSDWHGAFNTSIAYCLLLPLIESYSYIIRLLPLRMPHASHIQARTEIRNSQRCESIRFRCESMSTRTRRGRILNNKYSTKYWSMHVLYAARANAHHKLSRFQSRSAIRYSFGDLLCPPRRSVMKSCSCLLISSRITSGRRPGSSTRLSRSGVWAEVVCRGGG